MFGQTKISGTKFSKVHLARKGVDFFDIHYNTNPILDFQLVEKHKSEAIVLVAQLFGIIKTNNSSPKMMHYVCAAHCVRLSVKKTLDKNWTYGRERSNVGTYKSFKEKCCGAAIAAAVPVVCMIFEDEDPLGRTSIDFSSKRSLCSFALWVLRGRKWKYFWVNLNLQRPPSLSVCPLESAFVYVIYNSF